MEKWKLYIIFWLSQTVSQLGSSMTGFALTLWAYHKTQSALSMSLMSFCMYVPYIIMSLFSGSFIDGHKKKGIILVSDTLAVLSTLGIFSFIALGQLQLFHIYMANAITGMTNAFQGPASAVAIGMMVPKGKYEKASGMASFSNSVLTVIAPMLATFIYAIWGLKVVILIDLISFLFAFVVLLFFIPLPEKIKFKPREKHVSGLREGLNYLTSHQGIWYLILSMATANLFSQIGYENILPAMILARSNDRTLAMVTGAIGLGGILGGLGVMGFHFPKSRVKVIYVSTGFSFLLGDLLMGMSRNTFMWMGSAMVTSLLIPFINAGISAIMYEQVPKDLQGRVFAVRNALQNGTIPIGLILGGYLADHLFEPFMLGGSSLAHTFSLLVGEGKGSGMALMFLCTGSLGALTTWFWSQTKPIKALENFKK